ncbi:hypothetical protein Tco_1010211 [Tanacetum coccineum]
MKKRKKDVGKMFYDELVSWAKKEAENMYSPPIKPMSVTRDFQNSIPVAVYKMNMDNFIDDCISQKTCKNSNASVHKAVDSGKGKVDTCKGIMIKDTTILPNKVDKDKWIMTEDTNVVPNRKDGRRNNGIVIEERVNHSVNESDSDSDSDRRNLFNASMEVDPKSEYSYKFVDFLSEAEEELIELRKRNSNVNMTPTAGKKPIKPRPSRPKRQYELGENDIIIEHKEFMDNLMCQLIDGDDGMTNPFQIFESKNEEFPIHDEDTHWKIRKPKVIARCVFRHEKLKEPEKGKQSKWKRNAKKFALNEGETTNEEHYAMIGSYEEVLGEDIGMEYGNGLTLMFDQHKGLTKAIKNVMPLVEHRQCTRNIYKGFRKQYNGVEFKNQFWAASKASYLELFNKIMNKIKRGNPSAYHYLVDKNPKTWSRAYFRNKPLITMLEAMRVPVTERLNTMRKQLESLPDDICFGMSCLLEATTLRGGVVRGGVVRCGAMRGGRGRGGAVRGRGGTIKGGSRLIDEIDVDETSRGESIETSKLQLLVVLTQLDVQGVNEQAEGSVRQANNVTQEASLNEQAPGMDPKNLQARNLVRPRPKSKRTLKKKLSTTHPGGGSSMNNTHDLE